MTEQDALLAAICAEPDDDTLRLVYADFLEENGESDRAEFIRVQIELARTPAWEPLAVTCKWQRRDYLTGAPFFRTLPVVDQQGIAWNERPFRRGLGWHLDIRSLLVWNHYEPHIIDRVPIGAIHLWASSTIEQFREFARSRLVGRLRALHLATNPVEPLRTLRDRPAARGITDIHFEQASSPGLPFVVEDLLASPLGQSVRGLHVRMGYDSTGEFLEAIAPARQLERLSLINMGLTGPLFERLLETDAARRLTELNLRGNPLGHESLMICSLPTSLRSLEVVRTVSGGSRMRRRIAGTNSLRRLDLSDNTLSPRVVWGWVESPILDGLRSLELARCGIDDASVRYLTSARFWPKLVELNLRDNPISEAGIRHLLDAPVPADLVALVLTESRVESGLRTELSRKYGPRVVFDTWAGG